MSSSAPSLDDSAHFFSRFLGDTLRGNSHVVRWMLSERTASGRCDQISSAVKARIGAISWAIRFTIMVNAVWAERRAFGVLAHRSRDGP